MKWLENNVKKERVDDKYVSVGCPIHPRIYI